MTQPKNKKKGAPKRWQKKEYSLDLLDKVNVPVKEGEKPLYKALITDLIKNNSLVAAQDIMLVHNSVFNFLRIRRIQQIIIDEGDIIDIFTKSGQKIRKAHEASYLLNSVETQLRQDLKELMLTRKEKTKKIIGKEAKDITQYMEIEADEVKNGHDDKNEPKTITKKG